MSDMSHSQQSVAAMYTEGIVVRGRALDRFYSGDPGHAIADDDEALDQLTDLIAQATSLREFVQKTRTRRAERSA